MRYSRGLKAISLSMAFVMLFTNTAPLKAYAAGLQEEVQDAMAGETMQVPPEVGTSVEPGSEPQVLALEPTLNPEEIEPQVGSGQDGTQQDVTVTPSPAPATTPAATETPAPATTPEPTVAPTETPEPTATPAPTEMPEATATPKPTAEPSPTETPAVTEIENEIATSESANSLTVPQGAVIEIGTYEELQLLGTGETVDGVTYAADGQYTIAQDIELPSSTAWTLPEHFTGRIAPEEPSEDRTVYDAESDTIYVYHRFQLAVMAQENAAEEPVMDGDATAETFGMGQLIYPNGAEQPYLTYSPEHHYVISTQFCSDVPVSTYANEVEVPGPNSDGTRQYEGRDFPGQVVKTIDGVRYILIGNEEQLRAIGTDADVNAAVYQAIFEGRWNVDTMDNGEPIMLYGGDADLNENQNGTKDYAFGEIEEKSGTLTGRCGVNQETGLIDANLDIEKSCYGLKYSADANYIIFRDIDLEKINWMPLMFSGTMIGAVSSSPDKGKLWDSNGIAADAARATISNVTVAESGAIDVSEQMGIGFFGTISSPVSTWGDFLGAEKPAVVKNLVLNGVTVSTDANVYADYDTTVVSILVGVVNGLLGVVGGLLDALLGWLAPLLGLESLDLSGLLTSLLNVRKNDPTAFATGAFAGRIVGRVEVDNCEVINAKVTSEKSRVGGFVGYTAGETTYATEGIGHLLEALQTILNVIPGLGLGDLITAVNNLLDAGKLIPYSYHAPVITGCVLNGLADRTDAGEQALLTIGHLQNEQSKGTEFVGGFVGQQIGTRIENCKVINSNYTVQAEQYGGGFVGLARDAEIKGALSNLGADLVRVGQPESLLLNCSIELPADDLSVSGRDYIGGFAGALANSYTVNCTINMQQTDEDGQTSARALSVHGNGDSIGGWAGIGTVGWVSSLGGTGNGLENADADLLAKVGKVLTELLGSDNGDALLSLIGVAPSAIMGCQINGSSGVTVNAGGKYAGGFVGSGDGLYLTSSAPGNLQNLSFWRGLNEGENEPPVPDDSGRFNSITNLTSISANEYAGGIAGSLRTASIAGLLNNVAGVGSYLPFTVQGTRVSGGQAGYTVKATANYAGGGFGELVGGSVGCSFTDDESGKTPVPNTGVYLTNLASVTAKNVAAGFAAVSGPGELAGTGGIELDLLGFKLLKVNNLLSLGQGVEVSLTDCTVQGVSDGYAVSATGAPNDEADITEYLASGFIARSNSTKAEDCHALNLKSVTANVDAENGAVGKNGYAGGFLATSRVGGLMDTNDSSDSKEVLEGFLGDDGLLQVGELLGAINYLIPDYTNCTVQYTDAEEDAANVQADVAGGFAADFQSGTVNNDSTVDANGQDSPFAVYNISKVEGQTYAGGFAGKLYSGALADAGGGVSILGSIGISSVTDLLIVAQAYVPVAEYAGVQSSAQGLMVTACEISGEIGDLNAGSAGGFAGYASGAQISTCDVKSLRHTKVNEPTASSADGQDLVTDGASYYQVPGAVNGGRYAGGFIGKIDLGSAASVGGGLDLLGENVSLSNLLEALNVVVTTIEHSDVYGGPGGYVVLATAQDNGVYVGHAGGFAGVLYGGHTQDSNAHNFSHILGRKTAGGYVGEMRPGDVASVLDKGTILEKLINVDNLLSGLQVFVPTIRNSSTDSVPCGGVVWAEVTGDQAKQDGMAGGYVGHNEGGQIRGLDTETWHTVASDDNAVDTGSKVYEGPTSLCKAVRIRTVYGSLYAGGYTGFMEAADTAEAGGLSLLGGLINVDNLLSVLKIVYPIQTNTAVYGPLADLDVDTWNSWVDAVGVNGGYGFELAQAGKVSSQDKLNAKLANYIYGYDVYTSDNDTARTALASAGGYVGLMRSGVLTNCMAYDAKQVQAPGAAGGFAGRMETGGAASFGRVDILDLGLEIGDLLDVAEVFVPVVNNSSVQGYRSGLTVAATGTPEVGVDAGKVVVDAGYAGGFVGAAYGAQIQKTDTVANITPEKDLPTEADKAKWAVYPDKTAADDGYADPNAATYPIPAASCDVRNLRRVAGRSAVGGYVGLASAGSLASVNTNAGSGLLQGILNKVINSASDLLKLLPATVTTIYKGSVSPADPDWGFVVDGAYGGDQYADYAGGFAGELQAASLGYDADSGVGQEAPGELTVTGLRQVDGGLYAGGFVGLADVNAVAEVGGKTSGGEQTTILDSLLGGLLKLDDIDAADFIRTYIYHASVNGVDEGYRVQAHTNPQNHEGSLSETRWPGCAGGFAGAVLNGTVGSSKAANVATVKATNYTGGFVGHMGKSGVVDVDNVSLLDKLVNANAGVLDLFGTQVQRCTLTGYANGLEVIATGGQQPSKQPIAGGFAGYGDLGRVDGSTVTALKKVSSDQVAGGFIGQTDMAYLVSLEADSTLVNALLIIVNTLLDYLYLDEDELQDINLVDLNLGFLKVEVLSGGNALKVELLGIPIVVALSQASVPGQEDVAIITIGDSEIRLPCTEDGITQDQLANVEINLIKGNRTEVDDCTVTGIDEGYDVFAGGAGQDASAIRIDKTGSAGGFVGYNHEGKISNSKMVLCDVVKGVAGYVGPFTGYNDLKSVYTFNDIASIEGDGNQYSIYRASDPTLKYISSGDNLLGSGGEPVTAQQDTTTGVAYNRYDIDHIVDFEGIVDTGNDLTIYAMFEALNGAVMTDGTMDASEAPALAAYQENGAKAVLMLDTPNDPNPGTMVPEPGEGADPCLWYVDLTVNKVWDDWFNFEHAWPNVTLKVIQHKFVLNETSGKYEEMITPEGTKPPEETKPEEQFPKSYATITLTKEDQESVWSAVWSTVLRDAPVFAFEDKDGDKVWDEGEKITAYYVYTVEEPVVPDGYEAIIDNYDPTDAGDYELTVTNKRSIPLPDTGAGGDAMFVAVGVGILLLGLTLTKRRRPRKGER